MEGEKIMEKNTNVVMSKNIADAIDKNKLDKKMEDLNIIKTLCAPDKDIEKALKEMGVRFIERFRCKNRDDLQKLYILHVGLDRVIDLDKKAEKAKKYQTGEKSNLNYQNALQALRDERAQSIIELFESTKNKKRHEQIFADLSENEKEEVARVINLRKGIEKMDEMFERLI